MTTYQNAREFFEAARSAAIEVARYNERVSRMEQTEGLPGAPLSGARGGSRRDVNGMARVDARIDLEAAERRHIEEDYALIDRAASVLFGLTQRGDGGVDALLGWREAKVMDLYYLKAMTWRQVASVMGMSERWCQLSAAAALDLSDAYGAGPVIVGHGCASDQFHS